MKGLKGVCYTIGRGSSELYTYFLGIEGLAGGFSAKLELPNDPGWDEYKVNLVDFDERAGRILISANHFAEISGRDAIRVYLADLQT